MPMRIRQALKVETGLNDGLSVPFLLFFIALAAARTAGHTPPSAAVHPATAGYWCAGRAAIGLARWMVAGPGAAQGVDGGIVPADWRGGAATAMSGGIRGRGRSMFIAAFVAGLAVQMGFKEAGKHSVEFAEEWGQLLNLSVFFLFGLVIVRDWPQFGPAAWLYAVLSLTVVRMLPVAIALIGTRLSAASVDVHGLVRAARPGVHRARAGVSGTGNAFAR